VCSTYIYIHTRNAFWVPRRTSCDENVKITYIYMYMVLWCFWSPFFNILFYLRFFRHKKVTKTYIYIYVNLSFFHKTFLSARSHSAFYVSFFSLVVISDFSICKIVTILHLHPSLFYMFRCQFTVMTCQWTHVWTHAYIWGAFGSHHLNQPYFSQLILH